MAGSLNGSPARSIGEPTTSMMSSYDRFRDLPVEIEGIVDHTVVSGWLKFRDQKKWKLRWGVITKLSPAADCVHLQLYRDNKDRYKQGLTKASLSLDNFLGVETGFTLDKESNTIAIVCRDVVVILAFDTRELLIQWQMKINNNLGDGQQFLVQVASSPPKAKINPAAARLHIQNHKLCLTTGVPPSLAGYWELKHLRRYGVVSGKLCFEGGSLCGKNEGLYVLLTDEAEEIRWHIHMASEGRLRSRRRNIINRKKSVGNSMTPYLQRKSSDFRHFVDDCSDLFIDSEKNVSTYAMNRSFENITRWQQKDNVNNHSSRRKWSGLFGSESSSDTADIRVMKASTEKTCERFGIKEITHSKSVVEENVAKDCKLVRHFSDGFQSKYEKDVIPQVHKPLKHSAHHSEGFPPLLNSDDVTGGIPSRPPKPLKYSVSMPEKQPAIMECTCRYPPHRPHDQYDNYDVPAIVQISSADENYQDKATTDFEKPEDVLGIDYYKSARYYNYDVPPPAVPVFETCTCKPKMNILVETQDYPTRNMTCVCNQFNSCWPYTWLRLGYCKKEPTLCQSIVACTPDNANWNNNNNSKQTPLYATVDLSKKKHCKGSLPPLIPKRLNIAAKSNANREPSLQPLSNSYVNTVYVATALKNSAKEIVRTSEVDHHRTNFIGGNICCKCGGNDDRNKITSKLRSVKSTEDNNYILMDPKNRTDDSFDLIPVVDLVKCHLPVVLISSRCRICGLQHQRRLDNRKWNSLNTLSDKKQKKKKMMKLNSRLKSKSLSNISDSNNNDLLIDPDQTSSSLQPTVNANAHHQSPNYRDSSSSNDSGFSFGSLKKVIKNRMADHCPECANSTRSNRLLFSQRSKSSEPFVERTMMTEYYTCYHKSRSAEAKLPLYPKHVQKKNVNGSKETEKSSSIPYMDSQSTASETSDMSDYIETLSLSSYSSSETPQTNNNNNNSNDRTRFLYQNTAKLKPRSRSQYEKVHKVIKF